MGWRLLIKDGADKGRHFPLSETTPTLIGKSHKDTTIRLNDLFVGRVHCQVHVEEGRVVVTDLETGNGTFVNGESVTCRALEIGDVLRVGNSHLLLQLDDQPLPGREEDEKIEFASDEEQAQVELIAEEPSDRLDEVAQLAGRTWGHYEIGELVERGCQGVVFSAKDLKTQRLVALKVLSPLLPANEKEMRQFVDVLRKVMQVRHPNLAVLFGIGKTGPFCWMAREQVEGESLAEVLENIDAAGRINWKNGLRVALHVGRALDCLHQQRLVHGNVTPANILLRTADKQFKLIDASLTLALQGTELCKVTEGTKLLDDLPYLAPEQLESNALGDHVSEIYSLGAVVYARLTGRPPFVGSNPEQTKARICNATLVHPRKHQPTIPDRLDQVVMRMLARRPEDRYQSMAEVGADLDKFITETAIEDV